MAVGQSLIQLVIGIRDQTAGALRAIRKNLLGVKTFAVAAVGALAGLVGLKGFANLVTESRNAADEIQKLAIQTGISTEALSQYRFVAEQSGVDFNQLSTALQKANRRILEAANGTGPAAKVLAEFGISAQQLVKLEPDKQFEALADAIASIPDPAERSRLAVSLFEEEGVKLLRVLDGGSAGIRALRQEADQLGLTLTRSQVDAAATANDAINRLGKTWQGLAEQIATSISPALTRLADTFTQKLAPTIRSSAASVVAAIEPLIDQFATWVSTVDFTVVTTRVTTFVSGLANALSYTGQFVSGLTAAIRVPLNTFTAALHLVNIVIGTSVAGLVRILEEAVKGLALINLVPDSWSENITKIREGIEEFRDESVKGYNQDMKDVAEATGDLAGALGLVADKADTAAGSIDDVSKANSAAANAAATAERATDRLAGAQDAAAISTRNHAAEAAKLVKDIDDEAKAIEASHSAQLQLAQAQRAGLEVQREVALSKGDTAAARRIDNELAQQEIEIAKLVAAQKAIEAEIAGKKVAAAWAEAQATGGLNDEKIKEIELLKIKSQIADAEAKAAEQSAGLVEKQVNDRRRLTPAIEENTDAMDRNTRSNQENFEATGDGLSELGNRMKTTGEIMADTQAEIAQRAAQEWDSSGDAIAGILLKIQSNLRSLSDEAAEAFGERFAESYTYGFTAFAQTINRVVESVRRDFFGQQDALENMIAGLQRGDREAINLASSAEYVSDAFSLVGQERLNGLRSALQDAINLSEELRESAAQAKRDVQDEVDRLKGNDDAVRQRALEERERELEELARQLEARGDTQGANDALDALALEREKARLEAERDAEREEKRDRDRERRRSSSSSGGAGGGPELGRLVLATDRGDVSVFTTSREADILADIARDKSRAL